MKPTSISPLNLGPLAAATLVAFGALTTVPKAPAASLRIPLPEFPVLSRTVSNVVQRSGMSELPSRPGTAGREPDSGVPQSTAGIPLGDAPAAGPTMADGRPFDHLFPKLPEGQVWLSPFVTPGSDIGVFLAALFPPAVSPWVFGPPHNFKTEGRPDTEEAIWNKEYLVRRHLRDLLLFSSTKLSGSDPAMHGLLKGFSAGYGAAADEFAQQAVLEQEAPYYLGLQDAAAQVREVAVCRRIQNPKYDFAREGFEFHLGDPEQGASTSREPALRSATGKPLTRLLVPCEKEAARALTGASEGVRREFLGLFEGELTSRSGQSSKWIRVERLRVGVIVRQKAVVPRGTRERWDIVRVDRLPVLEAPEPVLVPREDRR